MPLSQTSILNILAEHTLDWLTQELIEETPEGDDSRPGLLRLGRLIDDPTITVTNLYVREGGNDWIHTVFKPEGGIDAAIYQMSGMGNAGVRWWRRFRVQYRMVFEGFEEIDARRSAYVIASKVEDALYRMPMPQDSDSFHEGAILLHIQDTDLSGGGGDGTWTWQGETRFEFMTERTPY